MYYPKIKPKVLMLCLKFSLKLIVQEYLYYALCQRQLKVAQVASHDIYDVIT